MGNTEGWLSKRYDKRIPDYCFHESEKQIQNMQKLE